MLSYTINNLATSTCYFSYVETSAPYDDIWVYGDNAFHSMDELNTHYAQGTITEQSPDHVRVDEGSDYIYFIKTLAFPTDSAQVAMMVAVDSDARNNSFETYCDCEWVELVRDRNRIRILTVSNFNTYERNGAITIRSNLNARDRITIPLVQDSMEYAIKIGKVVYTNNNGDESVLNQDDALVSEFDVTLDTLTDKTDTDNETITATIWSNAAEGKFNIKTVRKYEPIGTRDDPSLGVRQEDDGQYYATMRRVNTQGQTVTYRRKVTVIGNIVYVIKKYDNGLKAYTTYRTENNSTIRELVLVNYGRVFMVNGCFYEFVLCNADERNVVATLTVNFNDNPQ